MQTFKQGKLSQEVDILEIRKKLAIKKCDRIDSTIKTKSILVNLKIEWRISLECSTEMKRLT